MPSFKRKSSKKSKMEGAKVDQEEKSTISDQEKSIQDRSIDKSITDNRSELLSDEDEEIEDGDPDQEQSKISDPGAIGGSQNQRERQRQLHVNLAFSSLRAVVPSHPLDKKMSKHEILRAAIRYIRVLETQLEAMDAKSALGDQ